MKERTFCDVFFAPAKSVFSSDKEVEEGRTKQGLARNIEILSTAKVLTAASPASAENLAT